jgi:1-acyl-sn-glycerol-3-phosphate acyltransferase
MPYSSSRATGKSLGLSLQNIVETLAISWPTLVDAARGRVTKQVVDDRLASWSRRVVENASMAVSVRGADRFERGRTYVVMSNHQSLYDVPVLFYVLGSNVRMVTKKELFRVPIFGKALELGGFIKIDRGDRDSARASLAIARALLSQGTSVWIAPEGTRSATGELLPFKKGGFHLAMEANLPILPVSIRGTRDALLAKGLRSIAGAEVVVTMHRAIEPAAFAADGRKGRERLIAAVQAAIESGIR